MLVTDVNKHMPITLFLINLIYVSNDFILMLYVYKLIQVVTFNQQLII